jgi:large subunit ribosomal protein L15
MRLENLSPSFGSIKKRKRIGRGQGSGKGRTSTKGLKGAKSRSGYSSKLGFEGGQLPLQRRIPKFGFKKKNKKLFCCINLFILQNYVKNRILFKEVTPDICISRHNFIKILGGGPLTNAIKVSAHKFSKSSIESIKSAGGEVIHIL